MTRIIAGAARGRRLGVPARGTRPTSDRVRESLFSSLDSALLSEGASWSTQVVLDLYAGTGALGLEALSRGASAAYLVEADRGALRVLAANVAEVGLTGATIVSRRVGQLADPPPGAPATVVFADPPYDVASGDVSGVLLELLQAGWIDVAARVVVERPGRDDQNPIPEHWGAVRRRDYGDTALWYGHVKTDVRDDGKERD